MAAIEEAVPAEVLSAALYTRFRSRQEHTFAEKDSIRDAAEIRGIWSRRREINDPGSPLSLGFWLGCSLVPIDMDEQKQTTTSQISPPCILVIFGAAGDLTKRKLIPALYNLKKSNLLPEDFAVIGVASCRHERRRVSPATRR